MPDLSPSSVPLADDILAQWYASHAQWLLAHVRASGLDGFQAEDVVHDVFVRLASTASRQQGAAEIAMPRAYLARVARGLLIDQFRLDHRHQCYCNDALVCAAQSDSSPQEICERRQLLNIVSQSLATQRVPVRDAFIAICLEQRSVSEVAQELGKSSASVKKYVEAVRQHVREKLI